MKGLVAGSLLAAFILALPAAAMGQGFVVVEEVSGAYPVEVESITVRARVSGLTAKIHVEEVFYNTTERDIEGTFMFPVPEGSALRAFSMSVGGRTVEGNLTDARGAAEFYKKVVSALKDPGLLEFLGCGLYRFSIYPIPAKGRKTISFDYTVPLIKRGNCALLTIPLKSSSLFEKPVRAFSFEAEIEMPCGVANVSSTAYEVQVSYQGAERASVRLSRSGFVPRRDLDILVQAAGSGLGNAFMTCRGEGDEGDFFCLELAPGRIFKPGQIQPKDVTYILDVSGSMSGERIEAARQALISSAALLNPSDRCRLVTFSCEAKYLVEEFEDVSLKALAGFRRIVGRINSGGGTNMEAGLRLGVPRGDGERLHYIVLLSDGYPCPGISDEKGLAALVRELLGARARLFTLGVGAGVNQFLMDQLAVAGGGFSDYVPDGNHVAGRITAFMKKINCPVFEDLEVRVEGTRVWDLAPEKLPALFAGEAVRLFGRFEGEGLMKVTLSGTYLGRKGERVFEFDPAADALESPDLPVLWASRRAAFLLDRIRLENRTGLTKEVIALAGRYGIVTPFTSYLVTENGKVPDDVQAFLGWWNSTRGGTSGAAASSPAAGAPATGGRIGPDGPRTASVSAAYKKYSKMFGYEITSCNILFILDVSGSMQEPCGAKGADAGLTKLELARRELEKAIRGLPRSARFGIIAFSSGVREWRKALVPALALNKDDAMKFLDSLKAAGETHMGPAFERAFAFSQADAFYFISDGAPWEKGMPVEPKTVLDRVEFLNRFRMAQVHAVGFEGADLELMQLLTGKHDGVFRFVGDMKVEAPKQRSRPVGPLSSFPDTPEIRTVRRLIKRFSRSGLSKMLKLAMHTSDINTVRAVKAALSSLDSNSHRQTVCSHLARAKDYRARVLLSEVIGAYRQFPPAVSALSKAGLREKAMPALRAEVIALSGFRVKEAVRGLAEIWRALEDRPAARGVVARVRKAIEDITLAGGFSTASEFLQWWKVAEASFQLAQTAGSGGIKGQQYLGSMRRAAAAESAQNSRITRVGSKAFVLRSGTWTDTAYREGMPVREVRFLSEEYWQLVRDGEWAKYLAIGQKVLVCLNGKAVRVTSAVK